MFMVGVMALSGKLKHISAREAVSASPLLFPSRTAYIPAMTTFAITGMTCNTCRNTVEATLKTLAADASVTLVPPQATTSSPLNADDINTALAKVGKYRATTAAATKTKSWLATYYPLLLVIGLIAIASFAAQDWMNAFMGGFFAVFGALKLLDIPAFANAYARYDIIAKRFKPWGYAYPVIETALGLAFLFHFQLPIMLWVALALSSIGAIGVIQANLSKQTIQCACLGTAIQLPMSVVTVIENLGMAVMTAWMIWRNF
jgi:copper chaperone CopZ